jgi:hypothetical protein
MKTLETDMKYLELGVSMTERVKKRRKKVAERRK